ncbi:type III secretion system export apparatus subunit SctT [Pseudomonas matsuisoli]|uniref:EscT/YscT/HrcT family type III secretion system export apparatus protein n=1 Tax=Pseudomonas matsuisoli TaxID=1515666 RepID=A0A917PNY3_9PSED|nr:type III secretion system export apparatus subunit SctT [Pseudomonas matsuisoli]GGJ85853.1 EscT/YscT/HrcT family type III secretion system export apparatus protein [Pseudomonas matsuisoli]
MNAELANAFFELAYPLLSAFGLAVSRALGMVIITPAFNRLGLSGMMRSAVAAVITIPIAPEIFDALGQMETPPGALTYAGLLMKELVIGLVIGLLFGIPFWAAEVAGELIDLQRGSTMAQLVDPLSVGESSVMSTFLSVILIALFFVSGGFLAMLDGFYQSYRLWPAEAFLPVITQPSALQVLHILDRVMYIGVMMVTPLVIALLVADVLLAYLSRMSPQLHVFDLSLPIKNLLFAVLLTLYAAFLLPFMLGQLGDLNVAFKQLADLWQAS